MYKGTIIENSLSDKSILDKIKIEKTYQSDEIKVIFKNKVFTIKFSDKSTWSEAISYGKSIGIPEEQLDFPID